MLRKSSKARCRQTSSYLQKLLSGLFFLKSLFCGYRRHPISTRPGYAITILKLFARPDYVSRLSFCVSLPAHTATIPRPEKMGPFLRSHFKEYSLEKRMCGQKMAQLFFAIYLVSSVD